MQGLGALAICIGWAAIYAIMALILIEFVLWLFSLFGWGTYPVPLRPTEPTVGHLVRVIPLIYFIILVIGCLMGHSPSGIER